MEVDQTAVSMHRRERTLRTGFIVIGFSPAGVAAALEIALLGETVCVVADEDDSTIDEAGVMGASPLSMAGMPPSTWRQEMSQRLKDAGVPLYEITNIAPFETEGDTGWLVLRGDSRGGPPTEWRFAAPVVIGAPVGSPPSADMWFERVSGGRGISFSVASDFSAPIGAETAILGCGDRAVMQAAILAGYGSRVHVLCAEPAFRAPQLLVDRLSAFENVDVRLSTRVLEVIQSSGWALDAIDVQGPRGDERLAARLLFVLDELEINWDMWGGQARAEELVRAGKLYLAGLADGIRFSDHAGQVESGRRAAELAAANKPQWDRD